MLPPGHPRQFLAKIKDRPKPAPDMGPSLGEIKQAEAIALKLAAHRIRHSFDLQNTSARANRVMSAGSDNYSLASMSELLKRMR